MTAPRLNKRRASKWLNAAKKMAELMSKRSKEWIAKHEKRRRFLVVRWMDVQRAANPYEHPVLPVVVQTSQGDSVQTSVHFRPVSLQVRGSN